MKIGILVCGYNQETYAARSLAPWLALKDTNNFVITACSIPFLEYAEINQKKDSTQDYLLFLEKEGKIDKVFTEPEYIKETEARQLCLDYLLSQGCSVIILLDLDELFTKDQIYKILKAIEQDKFLVWYKLSFKNYFKTERCYFDEPFCPPRIFKCKVGRYAINKFIDDNHICYSDESGNLVHPDRLPHFTISKNKVWISHYSWLDSESSRLKIEYHSKHFSDGLCSYKWKDGEGLIFNEEYYQKRGLSYPIVNVEN